MKIFTHTAGFLYTSGIINHLINREESLNLATQIILVVDMIFKVKSSLVFGDFKTRLRLKVLLYLLLVYFYICYLKLTTVLLNFACFILDY